MIDFGDNKTFIENYKRLKSSRKMGELYGCSKNTITAHAKKIGYDYSNNKEIKITVSPDELMKLYLQLGSCNKVAEQFNCSGTAVRNCLINAGYQLENMNAKLTKVSDEDFIAAYNELKSADKVGKKFNCSGVAVLNHAKKIGYDVNSNKEYKLTDLDKQNIIESYYLKTSNELAKQYNVSRGMITKIWFDAGLIGKETNITPYFIDITGQKFGLWTVLGPSEERAPNGNIKWHCKCACGIERNVDSAALRAGTSLSCGAHKNISRGNEKIKTLLSEANIPFELEKKFPTCRDRQVMPVDFYVDNKYLIEYDGIQHFDTESLFDYEYTHKHDVMKSQWCKENHIPLIRIPYTRYNDLCLDDLLLETSQFIE